MKNIFLSVVVVAALVVAGIGGTLADWVDMDEGDYCLDAGYLNLVVDIDGVILDEDPGTGGDQYYGQIFCESMMEPGDSGSTTLSFHVYGDMSIEAGDLYVYGDWDDDEGTYLEPEETAGDTTDDEGELQDFLTLTIWWDTNDDGIVDIGETIIATGSVEDIFDCIGDDPNDPYYIGELTECVEYYIGIKWELPSYATAPNVNQCMSDSISGDIQFVVEAVHED